MQEGDSAIGFELSASDGTIIKLSSFKGNQNIVLCFYPKNHLFACPSKKVFEMAKSVISVYSQILETNSTLFAISIDTIDSQMKFVKDYSVPYLHLSDTEKNVCKTYAGLNIAGLARRSTFVIDKQGIVRIIFRDIDVKQHGRQIVESLKKINQEN
jgi:peroxiredoxin Q/BCP